MPDCDVCAYMNNIHPSIGFMSFRAGLSRVGVDALKAACEHRIGPTSVLGLQLRDQFIDLLWEGCLELRKAGAPAAATTSKNQRVDSDTTRLERGDPKKQRTDETVGAPIDSVNLAVEDVEAIGPLHDEEFTANKASVAELLEEVKRLRSDNRKFAVSQQQLSERQQQLIHKQNELVEVVQRLQSQQNVSDRLLCTVYDRQRSPASRHLSQLIQEEQKNTKRQQPKVKF
ncbi:hypothetical protein GN244_ATG10994 [Phytophthora infestans]|uniref:Uncharacterized protein n=1 Tax=Phytophthora infestans TaxID=4787 RepID=A0A833WC23_PHYIN|nr:hypothetical protein GN244_ATG10994 [Phytophthora infestans]KAF4146671.1 hypothetical protein GN958_ATG04154 [Phytophthora infestans]